jgi:type II secretion system protein D
VRRLETLHTLMTAVAALAIGAALSPAVAQNARPAPQPPTQPLALADSRQVDPAAAAAAVLAAQPQDAGPAVRSTRTSANNRRPATGEPIVLALDNVAVTDTIRLIVQITGKVVMPIGAGRTGTLSQKTITVITDKAVPPDQALDLLFQAYRLNGVGVVESPDVIILFDLLTPNNVPPPVLGPDVNVMEQQDLGALVVKVFRLVYTSADTILSSLENRRPDHVVLVADQNTNQLIVYGDIQYCQHVHELVRRLDVRSEIGKWRNFKLKFADAGAITNNILDLFEGSGQTGGTRATTSQAQQRAQQARQQAQQGARAPGTEGGIRIELRVTTVVQQNSITVFGDPSTVDQISELIEKYWDQPISPTVTRLYDLKYVDPIKVRDLLQSLLEQGSSRPGAQRPGVAGAAPRPTTGAGAAGSAGQAVEGIYRIEAYPDSNRLIVIAKTEESFRFLDPFIRDIDHPLDPGLPVVISLKHADALETTEVVNALLAEAGGRASITGRQQGLSMRADTASPFASDGTGTGGTTPGAENQQQAGRIEFPWQNARPRDDQTEVSALIGKVRLVPVFRQNAVAVLAPPEIRHAVVKLIAEDFDRPGRQVLIKAVIAEVRLTDALSLGIRFSSDSSIANSGRPDNSIFGFASASGTENNLGDLFDTSVLEVGADINIFIQALAQENRIRILQQPRIFTADNQEAQFFDGQDIPFITNSNINNVGGGLTQSFDYKAVGVRLNVRPRITIHRDVDMQVNLELSSIVAGQTLFGGAIVDRRETTSSIIVQNGQTIVLSGILRDQESVIKRKLPFLGDIPLLGELFSSRDNETVRTELVAFITPIVVDNPAENDGNFNEFERQNLRDNLSESLRLQRKRIEDAEYIRSRILPNENPPAGEPLVAPDQPKP